MRAFAVAMLGVLLLAWFLVRRASPDEAQEILRLDRNGPMVVRDDVLHSELSGEIDVSDEAVLAAFCVNGPYWRGDVTVDLDIVVATNERLYRAAELVADGAWDSALVSSVESDLLVADSPDGEFGVSETTLRRFGRDDIEAYLDASSTPPAGSAVDRFLIYAVSSTTTSQHVYMIDRQRIDAEAIEAFGESAVPFGAPTYEVIVAGLSGPVRVDLRDCARLSTSS